MRIPVEGETSAGRKVAAKAARNQAALERCGKRTLQFDG
jgi:hypothetical protein